jgi:hypothetical protein
MPVLLRNSRELPQASAYESWVRIPAGAPGGGTPPDAERELPEIGALLENAFDASAETWWSMARELGTVPSATLAHTPACTANASDFGEMLAWSRLVEGWAAAPQATLVVCDDPWLFRHLRRHTGVGAGAPPPLWPRWLKLAVRGLVARTVAAARLGRHAIALRNHRGKATVGRAALLVYGHPASTPEGKDGYFGGLLQDIPKLVRVLHVDCPPRRARQLAADGRTLSLHGWGNPLFALTLPFARWRPAPRHLRGDHGWLVRRAAAKEGGTGQAATIGWQIHCQRRWLLACRPATVAWPWENQSWERAFVRAAREIGVATVGYQHSVIGRQMLNYAPHSNPDGTNSLPDRVFCNGGATRDQLADWNIPAARLTIAGALRFERPARPARNPDAPVFMALPFDGGVAGEMVAAARRASRSGHEFLVKDHPMTPFVFADQVGVIRTDRGLGEQSEVSAVVFAATTVGLEAVLAGIPTLRFQPRGRVALDILPPGVDVPTVEADGLAVALDRLSDPPGVSAERVFAAVDKTLWRAALQPD